MKLNRNNWALVILIIAIIMHLSCNSTDSNGSRKSSRPNILLVMADDMGYSDLGCYGGEINTPNIDALAANGIKYTQFYNAARCCPTRASLLTGLYPQQAGIGHMVSDKGTPAYKGELSKNSVTIAEVLKQAGYSTYLSGKWHVTHWNPELEDHETSKHNWPTQRGFDDFFGMISGAGSFYDPRSLARKNKYIAPGDDFYMTEAVTEFAKEKIQNHNDENPFFMYVAYTAPHWPMHALPEDVEKYKGKYDQGWDETRKKRLSRMKDLGLIPKEAILSDRDYRVPEWSDDIKDKEWDIANMEVYAAMVDRMDAGIGEIVNELKKEGQFDNTLIFFLQDNGGCAEELDWIESPTHYENPKNIPKDYALGVNERQQFMIPKTTRTGVPLTVQDKSVMPGPAHTYTAYGKNWANVSNTPFKMYKHWVHEGGIATPLIVHWPNGVNVKATLQSQPSHLIDIMATCLDVAKATYPKTYNENEIIELEGESLFGHFIGEPTQRKKPIFWEHEGNRAVRHGKWKLVSRASMGYTIWDKVDEIPLNEWELYNMDLDRVELNDKAQSNPKKVEEMAAQWMNWARRTGTVPRP